MNPCSVSYEISGIAVRLNVYQWNRKSFS